MPFDPCAAPNGVLTSNTRKILSTEVVATRHLFPNDKYENSVSKFLAQCQTSSSWMFDPTKVTYFL